MKYLFYCLFVLFICTNCNSKTADIPVDLEAVYQQNLKDSVLVTGWYYVTSDSTGFARKENKGEDVFHIDPRPIAVTDNLTKIELAKNNNGDFYIGMQFDKQATEWWATATRKAKGSHLAFVVNDKLLGVSVVNHEITMGASAFGNMLYTEEEYKNVIKDIEKSKTNTLHIVN